MCDCHAGKTTFVKRHLTGEFEKKYERKHPLLLRLRKLALAADYRDTAMLDWIPATCKCFSGLLLLEY